MEAVASSWHDKYAPSEIGTYTKSSRSCQVTATGAILRSDCCYKFRCYRYCVTEHRERPLKQACKQVSKQASKLFHSAATIHPELPRRRYPRGSRRNLLAKPSSLPIPAAHSDQCSRDEIRNSPFPPNFNICN